jgi:hypothetical protein
LEVKIMAHDVTAVVSATVVDSWGTEASAPAYALADGTQTINEAIAEAQAYVKALDAVTDGRITRMHVQFVPALPTGLKAAAVATGARTEQTGIVNFSATGTSKRYGYAIPAVSDAQLTGDRINATAFGTASTGMDTLLLLLTSAATALAWANEHSQQIIAVRDAIVSFRKKRRQLGRSSLETA